VAWSGPDIPAPQMFGRASARPGAKPLTPGSPTSPDFDHTRLRSRGDVEANLPRVRQPVDVVILARDQAIAQCENVNPVA